MESASKTCWLHLDTHASLSCGALLASISMMAVQKQRKGSHDKKNQKFSLYLLIKCKFTIYRKHIFLSNGSNVTRKRNNNECLYQYNDFQKSIRLHITKLSHQTYLLETKTYAFLNLLPEICTCDSPVIAGRKGSPVTEVGLSGKGTHSICGVTQFKELQRKILVSSRIST